MAGKPIRIAILADGARAVRELNRVSGATTGLGRRIESLNRLAARSVLFGGAAALAGSALAVRSAAKVRFEIDRASIAFEQLYGSAKAASQVVAGLTEISANSQFPIDELATYARRLAGAGTAADQLIPRTKILLDTASAYGLNVEQTNRLVAAFVQIQQKGKVQAEEVQNQLGELIPMYQLLAKATGKNIPEIQKLMKEGKLLSKDVLPELFAVMQRDYGGSMVKQANTLQGRLLQLKAKGVLALTAALRPLFDWLRNRLPGATDGIVGAINNRLAPALAKVPSILDGAIATFNRVEPRLKQILTAVKNTATGIAKAIADTQPGVITFKPDGVHVDLSRINYQALGTQLGTLFTNIIGAVDTMDIGEKIGRRLFPFFVGISNTFFSGMVTAFKQDPVGSLAFIATFATGIGGMVIKGLSIASKAIKPLVAPFAGRIVTALGDAVLNVAARLPDRLGNIFLNVVTRAGSELAKLPAIGFKHLTSFLRKFDEVLGKLPGLFGKVLSSSIRTVFAGTLAGLIRELINKLASAVDAIPIPGFDGLAKRLRDLANKAGAAGGQGLTTGTMTSVNKAMPTVRDNLTTAGRSAAQSMAVGVLAGRSRVTGAGATLPGAAQRGVGNTSGLLAPRGQQAATGMARGISDGRGPVQQSARSVAQSAASAVGGAVGSFVSAGFRIAQGLASGIRSAASSAASAAASMARNAYNAAKSALGIRSPSKVFQELGNFVASGFALGIVGKADEVRSASLGLIEQVLGKRAEYVAARAELLTRNKELLGDVKEAQRKLKDVQTKANLDAQKRAATSAKAVQTAQRRLADALAQKADTKTERADKAKDVARAKADLEAARKRAALDAQSLRNTTSKSIREAQEALRKAREAHAKGLRELATLDKDFDVVSSEKKVKAIEALVLKYTKALTKLAEEREAVAARLEAAQSELQAAIQVRDGFITQLTDQARQFAALSSIEQVKDGEGNAVGQTAENIRQGLADRLKTIQEFTTKVQALAAQGLDKGLIKQILEQGPEVGSSYAEAILAGGPGSIANINALQSQIDQAATTLGEFGGKHLYQSGVDSAQQLVDGLLAKQKELEKAAITLAEKFKAALAAALKLPASNLDPITEFFNQLDQQRAGIPTQPTTGARRSVQPSTDVVHRIQVEPISDVEQGRQIIDKIAKYTELNGPAKIQVVTR